MSRLWNSVVKRLWPSPPGAIGIGFGTNSLIAVRTAREGNVYRITHASEIQLPFSPMNNSQPGKDDCAILAEAMQRLAASVPQSHWPLQFALPDPMVMFRVIEFDSLPEAAQDRAALALFRLEKEFPTMAQMQCTTQVIGEKGERKMLLALFIRRSWLDCIGAACRAAKFVPGVIDGSASYLFNRFYDVMKSGSGGAVLISIEISSWSILFCDDALRPQFLRSRWRDTDSDKDEEHEAIVNDVERLIISYVSRTPGARIDRVFLCATETDRSSIVARLDRRMQRPCIQLDATGGFGEVCDLPVQHVPVGVLAASVPRT